MTAGRAIVSSDCGGMPELIEHERTGLLARNGDPDSFVQALRRMIEDDGLRARCGAAARAEVEKRLTDTAIAGRSVEVYRACLAGRPPVPVRVPRPAAATAVEQQALAELRAKVAKLESEVAEARRREAEARTSRQYRWGSALLNVATLGRSKRPQ
jgi:hypothetical protein